MRQGIMATVNQSVEFDIAAKVAASFDIGVIKPIDKESSKVTTKNKPENLKIIFSYGGKQDHLIDDENDRHAKIFNNQKELLDAGYIDASGDDLKALTPNKKVGLIFH